MTIENRESLERSLPFQSYVAFGLGIIVGVGWVVYSGQWLMDGGPLGAILAFVLGGLMLLPIGMCYAELTAALPLAGGEMSFSYRAFGVTTSFLTAWLLALGYVVIAPFETIAIGALSESLVPQITTDALYTVGFGDTQERVALSTILPGLVIGGFLIWLNWHGAKDSAKFQTTVVVVMFTCAALFCIVAFWRGDIQNLQPLFANQRLGQNSIAAAAAGVISVLVVVPFFLAGFDAIPQAAEESGDKVPPRQLGLAIIISILSGSVFYVLIILAVSMSMPWTESAKLPMTTSAVFEAAFGFKWAAKLVIFTALLGLISTLNGMLVASSRLLFSMGRGGLLPQWFAGVHPIHRTPKNALLFVGAISLIGPFIGKFALTPIVNTSSFSFTIALAVTCMAAIRLRRTARHLERPYRAPAFALYSGTAISILLLLLMVVPQSPGRLNNLDFLIVFIWLALGIAAYVWRIRRHPLATEQRNRLILGDYAR